MRLRKLTVEQQDWELKNEFRISRGARTKTEVVLVTISEENHVGRAEAVPTAHYNESIKSVLNQIEAIRSSIESGLSINELNNRLAPGSARNALDCALWDLQARKAGTSVAKLTQTEPFDGCDTAQTLSMDSINKMADAAKLLAEYPLIKVKFDSKDVIEKMQAICKSAPNSRFIIDANEAWDINQLNYFSERLVNCNVSMIEQPLPSAHDSDLNKYLGAIPLCADESIHTRKELAQVTQLYQYINIKLDKTGGLTEAIKLLGAAKENNMGIMVGCMVGTSLAMAPATLLTYCAEFVDLDGPTLLASDHDFGFKYNNGKMEKSEPKLWGGPYNLSDDGSSYGYSHDNQ